MKPPADLPILHNKDIPVTEPEQIQTKPAQMGWGARMKMKPLYPVENMIRKDLEGK